MCPGASGLFLYWSLCLNIFPPFVYLVNVNLFLANFNSIPPNSAKYHLLQLLSNKKEHIADMHGHVDEPLIHYAT